MRSLPLLLALGLLLGALTACGASRPKGTSSRAADQHYTARQIERAFAAQGIVLRLANEQVPGYVVLQSGNESRSLVAVLVGLSAGIARPTAYETSGRRIKRGNVWVSFGPAKARAVENALARLD